MKNKDHKSPALPNIKSEDQKLSSLPQLVVDSYNSPFISASNPVPSHTELSFLISLLCFSDFVKWWNCFSQDSHLAGRWQQPGSPFWPECPACRCWASFLKRNECREGAELTSSPPRWPAHSAGRKVEPCSLPPARSPLSSSHQTSWMEKMFHML